MATIATLAVKLTGDTNGFMKAMNDAEAKAQTSAQLISARMGDIGTSMMNVGRGMTTFVTLPILGAGVGALKMASDLEESKNKINVVFGEMASSVMAWSQNSDTAMGQSQQQALEAAGTYGNLFLTLGLGQKPAAEMATGLVELASDLASFNNASPAEVLAAIQSGMVGQVEPMRKFGVNLNESAVAAKAMQLGLADANGELSESAKAQARYALIFEQTATAQGDFARTAEGVANQTRILQAQFANAAATLGTQLLPIATQLIGWLSQTISWFQAMTPEQQKWVVVILAVVAAIGPLLIIVGALIGAIGAIIPVVTAIAGVLTFPLIAIIAAVIAVVALLYLAWTNNWGGIQEKTAAAIAFIQGLIASGMQFIHDLTSGKLGVLSEIWNRTWSTIQLYIQTVTTNIKLIIGAFQAALHGDWTRFGEMLRMVWDNTWRMIGIILSTAWANLRTIIGALVTSIIDFFKNTDWGQVGRNILEGIASGLRAGTSIITNAARSAAQAALDAAKGFLGIRSASTLFEMQVGWQMAAGAALGWERGLGAMMPATMPQLVAAPTATVAGLGSVLGGEGGAGAMVLNINISSPGILDEKDIANRIGNAVEVVLRERGYRK